MLQGYSEGPHRAAQASQSPSVHWTVKHRAAHSMEPSRWGPKAITLEHFNFVYTKIVPKTVILFYGPKVLWGMRVI